jgi:radical SAM superfamily enzyme YgiQ (UPF0313 family)
MELGEMRILLISANTETINMPVLPLGLACVAEAVQNAGHEIKLLDLMNEHDGRLVLEDVISEFQPEIIGISVRNIDDQCMEKPRFLLDSVEDVVSDCRRHTDAPIIIGGAGYSIFPESCLEYLGADMGIAGEGESAFVTLLERLGQNKDLAGIPGLYLSGQGPQGKIRYTANINEYALPLLSSYHLTLSDNQKKKLWIPFQTRRGCPLNCSYCSTASIEGVSIRKHSPAVAVEALAQHVEAGFNQFFFVDNIFNLPLSYAKELCTQIVKAKLSISWRCILYPWKVDEELVEKMAEAGCKEVSMGFDSGSEPILRAMNKRFLPEEVRKISEILKRYGIVRMGFLLLGGPGENKKTVIESLTFADSLDLEAMKITMGIRIYPNTDLARIATKEGRIEPEDALLLPKFYMVPGLEEWLRSTVSTWMSTRPNWIQ